MRQTKQKSARPRVHKRPPKTQKKASLKTQPEVAKESIEQPLESDRLMPIVEWQGTIPIS